MRSPRLIDKPLNQQENRPPGQPVVTPRQLGQLDETDGEQITPASAQGAPQDKENLSGTLRQLDAKLDAHHDLLTLLGSKIQKTSVESWPQRIRNFIIAAAVYPLITHGLVPWFSERLWPGIEAAYEVVKPALEAAYESVKRTIYDLGTK